MTHWRKPGSYQSIEEYDEDQLKQISTFRIIWLTVTLALFLSAVWIWLSYGL